MDNAQEKDVQIVTTVCTCERCTHVQSQAEAPRKFLSHEQMFDILDERDGIPKE